MKSTCCGSAETIQLVSTRMRVWSLASISGSKIQHCRELWSSPEAAAPIQPLAWELPHATGAALKREKKEKSVMYLMEKIYVLDKLCSSLSLQSFWLWVQCCILKKVSLNRNKHKTRVYIDWLIKMLWPEALRILTLYFLQEQWFKI